MFERGWGVTGAPPDKPMEEHCPSCPSYPCIFPARPNCCASPIGRVIVNGDDFGLSPGVNQGIISLFQKGALTSTSSMVNQPASDQAIQFALRNPGLGVGLHLNLSRRAPLLSREKVRTLVDRDGRFLPPSRVMLGVLTGRVDGEEIRAELAAEIQFCQRAGLAPTHLDSHNHLHAMPIIGGIVEDLGRRNGMSRIRTPRVMAALVPYVATRGGFLAGKRGFGGSGSRGAQGLPRGEATSVHWRSFQTTSYLMDLRRWLVDRWIDDLRRTPCSLGLLGSHKNT